MIDVGYAGVIGADRLRLTARPSTATSRSTTSTATPTGRSSTTPTCRSSALLPWRGGWDDLPAAHAAAVVFDLLTAGALWLLGRRLRGPELGALLAYAWATFPFTLLVANSNANDALVGDAGRSPRCSCSASPRRAAR